MTSLSILPSNYDVPFIIKAAEITNHYGFEPMEDGIHFRYQVADFDRVQAAIAAYPVSYLEVARPRVVTHVSFIRDTMIAGFVFAGHAIRLDVETRTNLVGAVLGLDRDETVQEINWSLGGGQFITISRDMMYALADAAFAHIQACFNRHRALIEMINASSTINELAEIDIQAGWPENSQV